MSTPSSARPWQPKQLGEKGYRFWWHRVVLDSSELSRSARLLAGTLATYMRDDGRSWPSQKTLCADLVASDRAIRKWAAELEEHGFIRRVGGHPGRQVEYRHHLPQDLPVRTLDRLSGPEDPGTDSPSDNQGHEASDRRHGDAAGHGVNGTGKPDYRNDDAAQTLKESSFIEPSTSRIEPTPPTDVRSKGKGCEKAAQVDCELFAQAEDFMSLAISHLPAHVQERFYSDWDELVTIDPDVWNKARHAIVAVLRRGDERAIPMLYKRMLTPDERDTWETVRDVAKVLLSRLHKARREIDTWYR